MANLQTSSGVDFNRVRYQDQHALERWEVVRDVCSGDQRLREGAYLPFLNSADQSAANKARNAAYRQRAVLYAATSFTRDGLVGLAFRLDPRTKLPSRLEYLLEDADGAGTSIYQQSQASLANVLEVGRHGLYVDYSASLNRPIIKAYRAEDIINWRHEYAGGQRILTLLVLHEEIDIPDGYGFQKAKQYRELALEDGVCVCRVWREGELLANDKDGLRGPPVQQSLINAQDQEVAELVLRSSGKPLDFIPFMFIGSQTNDASIDSSPLYAMAQVNVAHFRNSADYEDSVWYVGQVQPFITGLTEEWRQHLESPVDADGRPTGNAIYVGSRTPIPLPAGGTFGFAQAQPNNLVGEAMAHKEEQMIALGARMITEARANKTATGEENDREATTSVLALCVSNVSEAYQACIRWCARYLDFDLDGADTYKINQEFAKASADPAIIAQMVSAWQAGLMAKADVRASLRKIGLIATEREDADIDSDLEQEGPRLGAMEDAQLGLPPPEPQAPAPEPKKSMTIRKENGALRIVRD